MQRFLIRSGVSRQTAEAVFGELGWTQMPSKLNMPDVIAYKSSWVQPGEEELANYLENIPLDCSYVLASDGGFAEASQAFAKKNLLLPAHEIVAESLTVGSEADQLRTIGRLGLLAHGQFDKGVFSRLAALLIKRHDDWQRFALYALSNTSWSEFEPVLEEGIKHGAFGDLAESAQSVLDSLRASRWNESLYAA